jgi:hypothetical protein
MGWLKAVPRNEAVGVDFSDWLQAASTKATSKPAMRVFRTMFTLVLLLLTGELELFLTAKTQRTPSFLIVFAFFAPLR